MDKSGKAYVLHPIRLMFRFEDVEAQVVALLHDTVEDSDISLDDVRAVGIPEVIVEAVDAITKRPNEDYDRYLERVQEMTWRLESNLPT